MLLPGDCSEPAERRAHQIESLLGRPLPHSRPRDEQDLLELAGAISAHSVPWTVVQQLMVFRADHYGRHSLFLSSEWELLLLCWLPGQQTNIHGHGGSQGLARVIAGELQETRYRPRGDSLLEVEGHHSLKPPEMILLDRPGTVHRVRNPRRTAAISLHLYTPPLDAMEDLGAVVVGES